jgi:hypothetical protein
MIWHPLQKPPTAIPDVSQVMVHCNVTLDVIKNVFTQIMHGLMKALSLPRKDWDSIVFLNNSKHIALVLQVLRGSPKSGFLKETRK